MAKRFDPPMPLHPIRDAETLVTAEPAVYRAAIILLVAYWSSGCRELPPTPTALSAICRIPPQHLAPLMPQINAALAEVCPRLATAYSVAKAKHAGLVVAVQHATSHRLAKARARQSEANRTFSQPLAAAQPIARVASPYVDTAADMPALRALAARQRADTPGLLVQRRGNLA